MSRTAAAPARRRTWVIVALAALMMFVVPMATIGWLADAEPEIRVMLAGRELSSLVIDGEQRILVINTADREAAGALLGRIAQPWEADPTTIVSGSEDLAAIGLWEALQRLEPRTVVVAGIPGADPLWAAIDAYCVQRRIELHYIAERANLATERLEITLFGELPESDSGSGLVIRRGDLNVVIALDEQPPDIDGQVLIHAGDPAPLIPDLFITSNVTPGPSRQHEVIVDERERVTLLIEEHRVRVFDGTLRLPVDR
ncbi:MAG: hypothetical protein ACRD1H_11775 [Vicinamibacterales bacterium]